MMRYTRKSQEKFLKSVWPGKVTVVLKRKKRKKIYGVDRETIALRIPNYRLINELLRKTELPLTGTSANISGQPAPTKIKEILTNPEIAGTTILNWAVKGCLNWQKNGLQIPNIVKESTTEYHLPKHRSAYLGRERCLWQ